MTTPPGYWRHSGGHFAGDDRAERQVSIIFRNGRTSGPRTAAYWTWRWLPKGPHDFDIIYWKYL